MTTTSLSITLSILLRWLGNSLTEHVDEGQWTYMTTIELSSQFLKLNKKPTNYLRSSVCQRCRKIAVRVNNDIVWGSVHRPSCDANVFCQRWEKMMRRVWCFAVKCSATREDLRFPCRWKVCIRDKIMVWIGDDSVGKKRLKTWNFE